MLCCHDNSGIGRTRRVPPPARTQDGFAIVFVMFILLLGAASIGLTFNRPTSGNSLSDDRTPDAFATVKGALTGYAVRQGVFQCKTPGNAAQCSAELAASSKLGEFPCPDNDNDGVAEVNCAAQALGRVPWKTLGIPEPKDGAGETLWYAVSPRFLNNASNPIIRDGSGRPKSGVINNSTPGSLTVLAADGSTQASTAVAVIFSPGAPLGAQNRSATALATCAGKPNVPLNLCAANYLETSGVTSNAAVGGPFIAGPMDGAFNDRLAEISTAEFMPLVEMRLGSELRSLLLAYKYNSNCLCYPWADSWNYSGGIADVGVNRGRLPSRAEPEDWGSGNIPQFPAWLGDNDWHNQVYYSASKKESDASSVCLFCSANQNLTVKLNTAANSPTAAAAAIVLTAGTPRPGIVRPYLPSEAVKVTGTLTAAMNVFSSYFEDALNNNKTNCPGNLAEHADQPGGVSAQLADPACDTFVQPQSRAYDRDRLFFAEPETPEKFCGPAGQALLRNAPCNKGGSGVNAVCGNLVPRMAQCSATCYGAAQQMLQSPCRNTLDSSNCAAPIAALTQCTP